MDSVSLLEELVAIDSRCTGSNKCIIDYIKGKLSMFEIEEFKFRKISNSGSSGNELINLVVKISGQKSDSPLVFAGHTDTVDATGEWLKEAFTPRVTGRKLYGLGATDMKSGLACMISAALKIQGKPAQDVYLLFDSDEEDSGIGGRRLANDFSLSGARVIIPEPTDTKIIYAQKGCFDFLIRVSGKEVHSSRTNLENNLRNNAIYKAAKIIDRLIIYEADIERKTHPILGSASNNIGKVEGGIGANTVAGLVMISGCRRLLPQEDINREFNNLKQVVFDVDPKAEVTQTFWGETYQTDRNGRFGRILFDLARQYLPAVDFDVKSCWTEAALFAKYGETFIFGPGSTEMCHRPREYVLLNHLKLFSKIYQKLMEGK